MACESTAALVVLDTNIVLDLFIFSDPATPALQAALESGAVCWIATSVMRDELERVLDYTHLQPRMAFYGVDKAAVLAQFDLLAVLLEVAPRCVYVCKDADDQKFIDLAAQQPCTLVSKDMAVLTMRKRLLTLGVKVCKRYEKASEV
jgi:putative PIN family toxin of toxin-antitoxin system